MFYFNTNKPQSFFFQNTSCIRKPQVISGGGGKGGASPVPSPKIRPWVSNLVKVFERITIISETIYDLSYGNQASHPSLLNYKVS